MWASDNMATNDGGTDGEEKCMVKVNTNIDQWNTTKSIAPLTEASMRLLQQMEALGNLSMKPVVKTLPNTEMLRPHSSANLTNEFLKTHHELGINKKSNSQDSALSFYQYLRQYHLSYKELTSQISKSVDNLFELAEYRKRVCENTDSLDQTSRQLVSIHTRLSVLNDQLHQELAHYVGLRMVSQRLVSPLLIVGGDAFADLLRRIDGGILFMSENPQYKQSTHYLKQYSYCLKIAVSMIRRYIVHVLDTTMAKISDPSVLEITPDESGTTSGIDPAISFYYGKFQALAYKIQPLIRDIEARADQTNEYNELLTEIQSLYMTNRYTLLNGSIANSVRKLAEKNKNDRSLLFRTACSLFLQLCQDEYQLYYVFFTRPTPQLKLYLQNICTYLYDTLRPFIVHIEHIEILCELCTMLKRDMLELVDSNKEALEPFGDVITDILRDLQERLVFRAHIYFRTNILDYQPARGDLAYPDKLHMMRSIILSTPPKPVLQRADSSMSIESYQSTRSRALDIQLSHTELQGMWYPTVRRTLQCLSQLYRCVDVATFQGLSQEAISFCVQSVASAADAISNLSGPMDGDLFQIKHLLILREQIASFQVDFTVKETSLDFSKVKIAASDLVKRKNLFTMDSSNAILKFLIDGTPQVREQLLDSKKDADYQLKRTCQHYIAFASLTLMEPLTRYHQKVQDFKKFYPDMNIRKFRAESWTHPEVIAKTVSDVKRFIKTRLSGIHQTLTLYINNKETEAILLRPIKNNVIGAFVQLEQHLAECFYERDDLLIISCPTAEQVSLLLSSVALLNTASPLPVNPMEETREPDQNTSVESSKEVDASLPEIIEGDVNPNIIDLLELEANAEMALTEDPISVPIPVGGLPKDFSVATPSNEICHLAKDVMLKIPERMGGFVKEDNFLLGPDLKPPKSPVVNKKATDLSEELCAISLADPFMEDLQPDNAGVVVANPHLHG